VPAAFWSGNLRQSDFCNPGVEGRIILNISSRNRICGCGIVSYRSGHHRVAALANAKINFGAAKKVRSFFSAIMTGSCSGRTLCHGHSRNYAAPFAEPQGLAWPYLAAPSYTTTHHASSHAVSSTWMERTLR
jgi:hypothetical protein